MEEQKNLQQAEQQISSPAEKGMRKNRTRTGAVVVLVLSVPGLCVSLAALMLFYSSPDRFNRWLSRLPGDTVLRSLLFFAPVALFGVVLLALLYVRGGRQNPETVEPEVHAGTPIYAQFFARIILVVLVPLLLLSVAGMVFAFVSPERFANLIEGMRGARYYKFILVTIPAGLSFLVIPTLMVAFGWMPLGASGMRRRTSMELVTQKFNRTLVLMILIPSSMLLLLSLAFLGITYLRPGYFDQLLQRLTSAGAIRLGLVFGAVALLAIVLLSILYLVYQNRITESASIDSSAAEMTKQRRSGHGILIWPLTAGLFLTSALGVGLIMVALYLLIR